MKKQLLLTVMLLLLGSCTTTPKNYPTTTQEEIARYHHSVHQAAKRYQIDHRLIFAIIKVESSFNARAVSRCQALGLMQVKQDTAGHDVFIHIKKRPGPPSRRYLLDPSKNIDTGSAYLHLLNTRYLGKIKHPLSRRYAVIAAYNGGTRAVLRTFSSNEKQAIPRINRLSPNQVYQTLVTRHPSAETRRYLPKVEKAFQCYSKC